MKNALVTINLVTGLLVLVFGVVALLNVTRNPVFVVVGLFAAAIAATYLWLAKGSTTQRKV